MTTPNTPHRFIAGAIDLGEVKAKAEARAQAAQGGVGNPGGTRTGVAVALTLTMEKAGTIQGKADATNAIATDYNVIDVKGQLALITKL